MYIFWQVLLLKCSLTSYWNQNLKHSTGCSSIMKFGEISTAESPWFAPSLSNDSIKNVSLSPYKSPSGPASPSNWDAVLLSHLYLLLGFSCQWQVSSWKLHWMRSEMNGFKKISTLSSDPNKRACTPYLILTKRPPCTLLFGPARLFFLDLLRIFVKY